MTQLTSLGVDNLFTTAAFAGATIKKIYVGTASVDPADASTGSETVTGTFTLTGAAAGDIVLVIPPATLEDDLIPKGAVCTADTVTIYLYANAAVDGAALTWTYIWFDVT